MKMGVSSSAMTSTPRSDANLRAKRTFSSTSAWSCPSWGVRWSFAEATAAPSIGAWMGPEKDIVPPHARSFRFSSGFETTRAPPAAENALFSESATTTRSSFGRWVSAAPRPLSPHQLVECASST